jgi:hypothetical protein
MEFVLTVILLSGFVLFFARLSFFLGYANLVQYATFLSSRAYQSGAKNQEEQCTAARTVLVSLLRKSSGLEGEEKYGIAQGFGGGGGDPGCAPLVGAAIGRGDKFVATDDSYSWLQGVRYTFRSKFSVSIFGDQPSAVSSASSIPPGKLQLTSESWLGREPTEEECLSEIQAKGVEPPDNGC